MKGLFVKDLKYFSKNTKFIIITLLFSLLFTMDKKMGIGAYSYVLSMMVMLGVGAVSNDESTNGFSYIFSLPITRKEYVIEKYIFSMTCILIGVMFIVIETMIIHLIKFGNISTLSIVDILVGVVLSILLLSIYLPGLIKFGNEKIRKVMFIFIGVISLVIGILITLFKNTKMNSVIIENIITKISSSVTYSIICFVMIIIIFLLTSYLLSLKAIRNKEF